jgi:hypothetical protein
MLESQEIPGVTPIQQKEALEADPLCRDPPSGAKAYHSPTWRTIPRQDEELRLLKRGFLAEWVDAVNGHDGFGIWACDVSRHPKDVESILHRHNQA